MNNMSVSDINLLEEKKNTSYNQPNNQPIIWTSQPANQITINNQYQPTLEPPRRDDRTAYRPTN